MDGRMDRYHQSISQNCFAIWPKKCWQSKGFWLQLGKVQTNNMLHHVHVHTWESLTVSAFLDLKIDFISLWNPKIFIQGDHMAPRKFHAVAFLPTELKVLSQGMCMSNMKALPLLVKKQWPRLKLFKSRSNFKVQVTKSHILVPMERSCRKECTCEIWKL